MKPAQVTERPLQIKGYILFMEKYFLIQTTVFVPYVEVTYSTVLYYYLCCTQV